MAQLVKQPLLLFIFFVFCLQSCKIKDHNTELEISTEEKYANTIDKENLKKHLYIYASDEFEGRETGEPGQKKAVQYLKKVYQELNIPSAWGNEEYFQFIPTSFFDYKFKDSENVLAFIRGSEKPEEVLVISAHLDHEGIDENGNVFNGADDDGSGTVAILEIAKAFKLAQEQEHGPKRSILFLHVTGEEKGLLGSRYYVENPVFPLSNTIANLNIDMIGRIDETHKDNPNYLYLIGSDKLSQDLHDISEEANEKFTQIALDYTFNDDNDPNRFYYRSDHYNFAKNNIPVIFYFNGTHEDYHRISDTPDKINYDLLALRTKLIFHTAWSLVNGENRPKLNTQFND